MTVTPSEQTPTKGHLIAVGGLSGSGKSTVVRALMQDGFAQAGAVHINTDAVRKELWGVAPAEVLPEEAYTRKFSQKTYEEVDRRIEQALSEGRVVFADAVFATAFGRGKVQETADNQEAAFTGVWLEAPPETLRQRADARVGDVSDADSRIVDLQLSFNLGEIDWAKVDSGHSADDTRRQVCQILRAHDLLPEPPSAGNTASRDMPAATP